MYVSLLDARMYMYVQVLELYPEFAERCASDLLHDLTCNLREGFVDPDEDDFILAPVRLKTLSWRG